MRQEVGDHKGEVIQRKARRATQGAHNGPLLLGCFPGQLMWAAGAVLTVHRTALAPLADRLGGHPIALGQHARGLSGPADLSANRRGGAGFRVDRQHQRLLSRAGLTHRSKRQAYASIAQRTWSQQRSATKQLNLETIGWPVGSGSSQPISK